MNEEQMKGYFSLNQNAATPSQGQVDNDLRIKLEAAKAQAAKDAASKNNK